jgi:hypothetical protein
MLVQPVEREAAVAQRAEDVGQRVQPVHVRLLASRAAGSA